MAREYWQDGWEKIKDEHSHKKRFRLEYDWRNEVNEYIEGKVMNDLDIWYIEVKGPDGHVLTAPGGKGVVAPSDRCPLTLVKGFLLFDGNDYNVNGNILVVWSTNERRTAGDWNHRFVVDSNSHDGARLLWEAL